MTVPIQIRPASPEDAVELAELITELGYPTDATAVWSRIEKMPSGTYHTLVAVLDGKVVGFLGLLTLPG